MISLRYVAYNNSVSVFTSDFSFSFDFDKFIDSWDLFSDRFSRLNDFFVASGWSHNLDIKQVFFDYPINKTLLLRLKRLALNPKRNNGKRKLFLEKKTKCNNICENNVCENVCGVNQRHKRRTNAQIIDDILCENFLNWNKAVAIAKENKDLSVFFDFIDSIDYNVVVGSSLFNSLFAFFKSSVDK